jgi:glycogen(starch) synthase
MKILIVTNMYPPYYVGGYEVRCKQVAEALQRFGYELKVLTSVYGLPFGTFGTIQPRTDNINGVCVHRWLNQYSFEPQPNHRPWTLFRAKRELWDARRFLNVLASFQPDIVNWWSMYGLSKTLLPIPSLRGIPDVYWIEHYWMIDEYGSEGEIASRFWVDLWEGNWGPEACRPFLRLMGRWWERSIKREGIPTRKFSNHPRHVCFVSEYMRTLYRKAGFDFRSSEIIYGGVPTDEFYEPIRVQRHESEILRILYVGQISPDRGLHTVIDALGSMDPISRSRLTLNVVGQGPSEYVSRVKRRVDESGLTDRVSFLGKLPHEQMPKIYKQHDVLVFPSTRPEGLPLTMVEAMLAGCAVLTTGSGGAMEVAIKADLPLFVKNDSAALSQLLMRFAIHRTELVRIASRGQEVVLREFSFGRMIDRWKGTLQRLYENDEDTERVYPSRKLEGKALCNRI